MEPFTGATNKSADSKVETDKDIRKSGYVLTVRSDIRGINRADVSFGRLKKLVYATLLDGNITFKLRFVKNAKVHIYFRNGEELKRAHNLFQNQLFGDTKLTLTMKNPGEDPDVEIEGQPTQNIEAEENKKENPKQKDDSNDGKSEKSKTNKEHYQKILEEDYKKQLARKVKDVRIKFEKIKRLLLKVQYESLIVCREKENNGLLCPIEDFRTSPLGQHYSDRFKFYIGIDTETKEPALGFQDGYGFVKKMSKMEHSYPDHITKAVKVLEKAVKASKMAPSTPSVKTRVWHEVIIRTNFSQELMLLVLVNCPEESSGDDLKNLKKELTEFFQNGEGKHCRVVSLYIKAINMAHAQKVWGCSKDTELIMGTPFLEETLLNFKLHLSPSLEISQNRHTIKAICNGAEELLCPLDKTSVLIVGCSIGVYGFCMSKIAGEVLCVDTRDLIEEAKKNAKLNSITDCQFFGGNYKSSIIEAAKKITCAESCAIVVISDDNLALVSNSAMIKLRQIESLKRIVLVLELSNSRFNPIYQLSIPNFNNDLCSPFFPIRAIPVDSAPITNSYIVLILMERIELPNLPLFSKDKLDSWDRNVSFSLNPYEGNLDSRVSTVAGSADNSSAVMEQRRLIEEQKLLADIKQQRRYLVEEQIQNRLLEKQRREQLEIEHQKRRFEEEQQIILLQEECQKRLVDEEHQRRRIEEGLQMKICEREQLKKNARGTYQWISFEANYQRFLLTVDYQRNVLIEEQQRRRLEEEQRRRRLKEELQRRVMEDKQQMRLFEEAQQRRQLEEKRQIRQFEEEKSTRFKEWQRRKLEEEFLGRQLKEEEFQRTQLDEEEWQRRQLEGEWQVNRSEEQQRGLIKGEWQVRQVEEWQKKPVEEEQLKRQLETEQKMRPLEEKKKKDQLEEERKKGQAEEEQIRLEKERQWKLIEEARLKKRLVEEVRKQLLEEEQQRKLEEEQKRKQLEEEEKKKRLEKDKQKKKVEEERKKRELEEKRKKRNLEEERKRRKRLEEEQKRKKLEDEREKRKLEDERRKRKLEEGKRKREFEEKQKKPRWEEERDHVSQRSKDDAIVALISNTLKESGVTQLSADIAEKLKQVITEAMKSVGVLGQQNIGTGHAAEQYSQNMRGNEQRGAQQILAKAMTSVGVLGQQNIDTAKQYSQNMRGNEQRGAQQVLTKAMTSVGVFGQQNIDTAKQYSQNMHGNEQRGAQQVLAKAITSIGVLGQQNIDTAKQYSQNMRGDEQRRAQQVLAKAMTSVGILGQQNIYTGQQSREGQQSSGIPANTYVRYEHLMGASKRDNLNKYTRSEWQRPVSSIQNRNTSDTQHYIPDWNNKSSDSRYSCGVTSIQNINTSDTQRYVLDWNNKSSDGRYSCENNTYSQGKLNTTDNKYNYGDSFDVKQLPNTGEVSAEFKFRFKNEGYNSLNNFSQNMTDDRYNKDHCSETPASSMNQDISSVRFSFKDTLSQTLQDRESKIDSYRIDSASFHSWKDSFSPVSESQENPFRSYWNQKRNQMGPEKN